MVCTLATGGPPARVINTSIVSVAGADGHLYHSTQHRQVAEGFLAAFSMSL